MDDLDFSEDEIREQLEKLGYYNVPPERLAEFKRDLEQLVRHEKSKSNSSWSTLAETSSSESEHDRGQYLTRGPVIGTGYPYQVLHQASGRGNSEYLHYGQAEDILEDNLHPMPTVPHSGRSAPHLSTYALAGGHRLVDSLYPENEEHAHLRQHENNAPDTTIDSTSSNKKLIKRKVLRKRDGHAVIDESITESETDVDDIRERLHQLRIPELQSGSHGPSRTQVAVGHQDGYQPRPRSAASTPASFGLPEDYDGPGALIRPMSCNPHVKNIKKNDPVARYQQYRKSWTAQKAPGETNHKGLRWNVREHMLYHDEVVQKKQSKVFVPNKYTVPSDKKRKSLRWQIRMDMAQGLVPPSIFE